jgi:hypothetical protein
MKNSAVGQIASKSSFRQSVSILLVFAAFAVSNAKAAGSKNLPSNAATNVHLSQAPYQGGASFETWETDPDVGTQGPAPWCYTNAGRFPMQVSLPAGVSCYVNVPYWPYTLYGTTGF